MGVHCHYYKFIDRLGPIELNSKGLYKNMFQNIIQLVETTQ